MRKSSAEKKPRGRPAGPDVSDIRGAILASAETLFARQGYAATSIRQIADEVDVNPAMIHYYFGSKHDLIQQVLESALQPLAGAIARMRESGNAPVDDIVRLLLHTFCQHPNLPTLVVREVMLPGGVMQEHFRDFLAPRLGGAIPDLLEREKAGGRLHAGLDSRIGTLIILSLCAFPMVVRDLAGPVLEISFDAAGMAALERNILQLLEEGIVP